MSDDSMSIGADGEERRRFFRIDDHVAIKLRVLSEDEFADALARSGTYRNRRRILSRFTHETERHLPQMRVIENQYPGIATYLQFLEKKIDFMAEIMASQDDDMPNKPTHKANVSAQGIRFRWHEQVESGAIVELRLQLFPSRACLLVHGSVIRCDESDSNQWAVVIDYSHIHEEDREVLVKHIHNQQLDQLRRNDVQSASA